LGQQCAPKRNLTWGFHWLSRAEQLGQADAQGLMAFLHASDALREVYNFTGLQANLTRARELYDIAAHGGSTFAAMAVGFRHGYGIGLRESCPESAAFYEKAARSAIHGIDEHRRHSVDQSNANDAEHLTPLSLSPSSSERMDTPMIEYMDYCASIGDLTGKIAMGTYFHQGAHAVPHDRRAAEHHFRTAAHRGDGMGHAYLGMMQLRERRFRSAIRSLRRATRHREGAPSGWAGLGYAHLYGAGVPQSDERAAKCLWTAARSGHLDSIYNMGVLTLQGRGVPASVARGFRFLSVAAEFSHPNAQLHVGHMVRLGLGVRKDCNAAQFFLKHAAEAGPLIRSLMGTALYAHDKDRPQRALMHYLLAAHAGVEVAQHNAGHLYAHEMPKLRPEEASLYKRRAAQYFKFAVLQGSIDAQVQLANLLVEAKDYRTAVRLLQEAGRAGSRDALFHLGLLFWEGNGVEANSKTALALWQSSDFSSKHAQLRGLTGKLFSVARFVVEFRAFLLFAGGILAIMASGGNPFDVMRRAIGGGDAAQQAVPAEWVEDGDDEDLFGDD
jgi:SEL1 protein